MCENKNEEHKIDFKARKYCINNDQLYRRALEEPLLKCIGPKEAKIAKIESHSGIYGEHTAGKNMALKLIRHGVFWPTMRKDCEEFSKSADHANYMDK